MNPIDTTSAARTQSLTYARPADLERVAAVDIGALRGPSIPADAFERTSTTTRPSDTSHLESLLRATDAQRALPPTLATPASSGWSGRLGGADLVSTQRAALGDLEKLHSTLDNLKHEYNGWRAAHPKEREPTDGKYTMGEILNGKMPESEQCLRIILVALQERPETVHALVAAAPAAGVSAPPATPAPAAPGPDAQTNPLQGLLQMLGPVAGFIGPVATILGGVLASPIGMPLVAAALAAIPPPGAFAAAAPIVAPIAGALLSMGGNMLGSAAKGASGAPAAAGGAAPAAGAPDLTGVINGISGLLGATGSVTGGPPAVPAGL